MPRNRASVHIGEGTDLAKSREISELHSGFSTSGSSRLISLSAGQVLAWSHWISVEALELGERKHLRRQYTSRRCAAARGCLWPGQFIRGHATTS